MKYLITGCNSDIGKAITKTLQEKRCKALLVSRSPVEFSEPADTTQLFRRIGEIDLTKQEHLEILSSEASSFFDEPFTVIHSVGDFWTHRPLDECGIDVAARMMESHYLSLYGVVSATISIMRTLRGGRFIAFSCNSVSQNYPEMSPFTSAKAAVECLMKCVANEYSGEGIQANAVAMPTILTSKVLQNKPQGDHPNYITAEELAQFVVNEMATASLYMNGNVIKIFRYSPSFYHQAYFERNPSGRSSTS